MAGFFAFGFFPQDRTFFEDVRILRPSSHYVFDAAGKFLSSGRYWNWSHQPDTRRSYDDTVEAFAGVFHEILAEMGRDRLAVPISGGLDSRSTVAGLTAPDGTSTYLQERPGAPLAFFPDQLYESSVVDVRPGDRVLMFTDGLVERRREHLDIGLARLVEVFPWLFRIRGGRGIRFLGIRDYRFLIGALFRLGPGARLDYRRLGEGLIRLRALGRLHFRTHFQFRRGFGILVPAMLARSAADLPALRRDGAVLDHILRSATGAGEDHVVQKPSSWTVSAG